MATLAGGNYHGNFPAYYSFRGSGCSQEDREDEDQEPEGCHKDERGTGDVGGATQRLTTIPDGVWASHIEDFLSSEPLRTMTAWDIGCNSGEVTFELFRLLQHHVLLHAASSTAPAKLKLPSVTTSSTSLAISPPSLPPTAVVSILQTSTTDMCTILQPPVRVIGFDIDAQLIARARAQAGALGMDDDTAQFVVQDILAMAHPTLASETTAAHVCPGPAPPDVIVCLSTTMWIHLHGGDCGLRLVLQYMARALAPGGMLVLEPQPWHAYRRALRRLKRTSLGTGKLLVLPLLRWRRMYTNSSTHAHSSLVARFLEDFPRSFPHDPSTLAWREDRLEPRIIECLTTSADDVATPALAHVGTFHSLQQIGSYRDRRFLIFRRPR